MIEAIGISERTCRQFKPAAAEKSAGCDMTDCRLRAAFLASPNYVGKLIPVSHALDNSAWQIREILNHFRGILHADSRGGRHGAVAGKKGAKIGAGMGRGI